MKKIFSPFLFLYIITAINAQDVDRGMYFAKKKYIPKDLPKFESVKHKLPSPVLDDNKDWEELYWKAWEIAFSNLKTPSEGSSLVSNWIDEGFWEQIFQWDTNFMAMFGRYANHIFPFIESQDNFYASQHSDGMICRVINEIDGADHEWGLGPNNSRSINPPLFGWAEVETYKFTGDKKRLALVLPVLEKYAEWIDENRRGKDTPHQLYWNNGQASGMDNTPRDTDRPTPAPDCNEHSANDPMGWVDMSSQMAMLYDNMSFISKELGNKSKAEKYTDKSQEIIGRINQFMWNDKTGLYHDINTEGQQTAWKTVATFWPMLANAVSPYQTQRLVENITNPSSFWRLLPLPSLAADQSGYVPTGDYWHGAVWAPTSYMVVKGLQQQGYYQLGNTIAEKFLYAMNEVFQKTSTIWEAYSPDIYMPATSEKKIYLCKPNFVGWSGLVPISMLIENIIGINADGTTNSIYWNLHRKDRHGIENLHFGQIVTSLICDAAAKDDYRIIHVTSNSNYTLIINNIQYSVKKGENTLKVKIKSLVSTNVI